MSHHYYCPEKHTDSPNGCYEPSGHTGPHRGYKLYANNCFLWGTAAPVGKEQVSPTFTREELAILQTALVPVEQFFPDLKAKLELAVATL